jgi:hypothetical protein
MRRSRYDPFLSAQPQCLRGRSGGVTLLAINISRTMDANAKIGRYSISLALIAAGAAAHVLLFIGQPEYPFLTF